MKIRIAAFVSICFCIFSLPAFSDDDITSAKPDTGGVSIAYENDIFRSTDRSYTNGVRISWVTDEELPKFLKVADGYLITPVEDRLSFFPETGKTRYSYALGQSMFTPDDIKKSELQQLDRPYAGWLYGTLAKTVYNDKNLDYLGLTLGVVGPMSLAKETQRFVHQNITDSPIAQGWHHQLENEPGIVLTYEKKIRGLYELSPYGFGIDFTPHFNAALGNIFTHASVGGTLRFGRDLPSDYGPPRVRPGVAGTDFFIPTKDIGWYFFAGFEGRAVARNIFLDGNTFTKSHSVDKRNFIADFQMGAAMTFSHCRLAYTHVVRTKEYDSQSSGDRFGVLTLTFKF